MNTILHRSIWLSRFVLGAAILLFASVAMKYIVDPVGAVAPRGITLGSAEAVTIMRVSGGIFLGLAIALGGCVVAERRLLVGLGFLATIATTVLVLRLVGLAVDGPGPFTLYVLKPEAALAVLSVLAYSVERRRRAAARVAGETRGFVGHPYGPSAERA